MAGSLNAVPKTRNPNYPGIASLALAIATEATDTITVTGTGKLSMNRSVSARQLLRCWFSKDANGDVPAAGLFMPNGGYATGTKGTVLPGPLSPNRIYPTAGLLAIDATVQDFKLITNTITAAVGGAAVSKAPATAIAFTAAHVVTASKFGIVLVQMDVTGAVTTKCPGATQTTAMAYNSAALALAALPTPDVDKVALGYIAIAAGGGGFTANTTSLAGIATYVNAPANGNYPPTFDVLTKTDGTFDLVVSETRVWTHYLNVRLPDGSVKTSGAIAFA